MKSKKEEAINRKKTGYNCAQAIACTYCDLVNIDEETMKNITQAFGTGMGTLEGTCGALSGVAIILGMMNKNPGLTMQDIRKIMNEFKVRNGTVTCGELKGINTGKVLRECNDCVGDAAEFLERIINEKDIELKKN